MFISNKCITVPKLQDSARCVEEGKESSGKLLQGYKMPGRFCCRCCTAKTKNTIGKYSLKNTIVIHSLCIQYIILTEVLSVLTSNGQVKYSY